MHGISFISRYRKYNTTKRSGNTSFCDHHVRITIGTSYRIGRGYVPVEHRSNYYFYFSEQREYLYSNSYRCCRLYNNYHTGGNTTCCCIVCYKLSYQCSM